MKKMEKPETAYKEELDQNNVLWDMCANFHGHVCGGLTIGYKAALYAIEILNIKFSKDEEIVCVTENDACGVDAIQVILGCSVGKGNLLFKLRGKQAFSFYNRTTGESVRLVLKNRPEMTREESFQYLQQRSANELFEVKETTFALPEKAKIFNSIVCAKCGETTAESMISVVDGEMVCPDCKKTYNRFAN